MNIDKGVNGRCQEDTLCRFSGQLDAYIMEQSVVNSTMQDAIAVVSIFEAVFGKIRRTTLTIRKMPTRTDKATSYKKSLMNVLIPWIERKYVIKM